SSRGRPRTSGGRHAVACTVVRTLRRHGLGSRGGAAATGGAMSAQTARPGRRAARSLGTRGVPNRHGGFEACAEHLARWLAARGWDVSVYCQEPWGQPRRQSRWRGVTLEHIPVRLEGSAGSVLFDLACVRHAAATDDLLLTLGFNTAVFFPWY